MRIREGKHSDIPEILQVLKASLGEQSSKKTEAVWRYKHIDNPFGESLVLVAEEKDELIGVRAFMRWRWQQKENIYSAFRAVDTATHPKHQGKGVFKKLTLKALELGKERGDHFVFNTPNAQSKPGYIKMGWKDLGKLNINLVPVNPLHWGNNNFTYEYSAELLNIDMLSMLNSWNSNLIQNRKLFTPKSQEYLEWRYINNPMQKYRIRAEKNLFIAGYIKKHSRFRELRISELIYSSECPKKTIKATIRSWAKDSGVHFISVKIPGDTSIFHRKISGNFGPIFTIRKINEESEEANFFNLNYWNYSLGDLELF